MQLGVTVTSLAIGALGEHALLKVFDPIMATAIAVVLSLLLILTFFHVVAGELVPKGLALERTRADRAVGRRARARVFIALPAADLVPAAFERHDPPRCSGWSRRAARAPSTPRPS